MFDGGNSVVEKVNKRSGVPYVVGEYKIAVVFYDRCGDETRQYSVSIPVTHKILCSSILRLILQDMQVVAEPRCSRNALTPTPNLNPVRP